MDTKQNEFHKNATTGRRRTVERTFERTIVPARSATRSFVVIGISGCVFLGQIVTRPRILRVVVSTGLHT